jgi:pimeloyl-ACP methyl ester carboxylesterase
MTPSTLEGLLSVQRHVADAISVLDGLDVPEAVILGHSWGGHLALQLAVGAPDRVTGLVLGEQRPMPVSQGQQTAALLPAAEVVVVPAAGHLPWHEQPGCVADARARVAALGGVR